MSREPIDLRDHDNPEWTEADFAAADGPEALSEAELAAFPRTRRPGRPRAEAPKEQVTLRLSPEVLVRFKAGGRGWQTRIDEALKRGDMSEALADVLRNHQRLIVELLQQTELLRSGALRVRTGNQDVSEVWIAENQRRIEGLQRMFDEFAPEVLPPEERAMARG